MYGLQRYLEPLVSLALSDLAEEVAAGLADAACCCQHSLSRLQGHTKKKSICHEVQYGFNLNCTG